MSFLSVRQWQRKTSVRCLYKAGVASNRGDKAVREEHAREAEAVIERRRIERGIRGVVTQDHLALTAIVSLELRGG
jgi:Cdc6-like AAA superfamily ATPase